MHLKDMEITLLIMENHGKIMELCFFEFLWEPYQIKLVFGVCKQHKAQRSLINPIVIRLLKSIVSTPATREILRQSL